MDESLTIENKLLQMVLPLAPGLARMEGDPSNVNLRQAGLSSVAAARLMFEVEAAYNISIPDADLTPENFATIRTIEQLVRRLSA